MDNKDEKTKKENKEPSFFGTLNSIKTFIKNNPKKVTAFGLAFLGTIFAFASKNNNRISTNIINKAETAIEKPKDILYHGVPMSELDKLAKEVWHGERVSIDNSNFLNFRYKSNRGHQHFVSQFEIDDNGNLAKIMDRYFPGQVRTTADAFLEEANKRFTFKK